ncbi:MAG: tetratricopeptide repeat protein [bacterium]
MENGKLFGSALIVLSLALIIGCGLGAGEKYKDGMRFYQIGEYKASALLFEEIVRDYPQSAYVEDAEFYLAASYEELGMLKRAEEAFTALLEKYPEGKHQAEIHYHLGLIALKNHQYDRALEKFLSDVITNYPDSPAVPAARVGAGDIYRERKFYDLAIQQYNIVLADFPQSESAAEAQYGIALCYKELEDWDRALIAYRNLQNYPSSDYPYGKAQEDLMYVRYNIALNHYSQGDFEVSFEEFKGMSIDYSDSPLADNILYWAAESLYGQRKYEEAIGWFDKTIKNFKYHNKDEDAQLKLGMSYYQLGRYDQALVELQKIPAFYIDGKYKEQANFWISQTMKKLGLK